MSVRQVCSGEPFDHEPTIMSIAKAGELLRCPICRREVGLQPDSGRSTPGVKASDHRLRAD